MQAWNSSSWLSSPPMHWKSILVGIYIKRQQMREIQDGIPDCAKEREAEDDVCLFEIQDA